MVRSAARALAVLALATLLPGCGGGGGPFALKKDFTPPVGHTQIEYTLVASANDGAPHRPVTLHIEMLNTGTRDVGVPACLPLETGVSAIGPDGQWVRFRRRLLLPMCAMTVPFSPGARDSWTGDFNGLLYGPDDRARIAPEGVYTVFARYSYEADGNMDLVLLERRVSFYWHAR